MNNSVSTVLVPVRIQDRGYDIAVGSGLIGNSETWKDVPESTVAVIVTNTTVEKLYAAHLTSALASRYSRIELVVLSDGEAHKTWDSLNTIFDHLLRRSCDRKTVLFALGGGVIGDVTGFAAACYMRGIPFVQVPTTLLAQVDSSVGGKTAINHPLGKNMIGAFYQPVRVVADLDTLQTLPRREVAAGLAEVIKYGPIADDVFFSWIEEHLDALLALDVEALSYAIRRSCEIKASVVSQDERESGLRAILNFGHTFGHAIEAGLGYGEWLHGEAVGCGMVMAADLSERLGLIDAAYASRIRQVVARAGLPIKAPPLGAERYFELMGRDKKSEGGDIRFVLIDSPGHAILRAAPDEQVRAVIESNAG